VAISCPLSIGWDRHKRAGVTYTSVDANHDHAVTQMGSDTYTYDANGNQTQRVVGGNTYNLSYDAENRLVGVSGYATATFVYDGDGNRQCDHQDTAG
jgi:YD repeat-containing protein